MVNLTAWLNGAALPTCCFALSNYYLDSDNLKKIEERLEMMPRVAFEQIPPQNKQPQYVKDSTYVMVILKEIYIGDNHEPWIKGQAEVAVTIQLNTGSDDGSEKTTSKIIGTFRGVKKDSYLPIRDVVLVSRMKVTDHLTISVDAIELDKAAYTRISSILQLVGDVFQKLPFPGTDKINSIISGLGGSIVNLISALDDDDVIMRESSTYIADHQKYGDNFEKKKYLQRGVIEFKEKLDEGTMKSLAALYGKELKEIEPSRVAIQIVQDKNQASGPVPETAS